MLSRAVKRAFYWTCTLIILASVGAIIFGGINFGKHTDEPQMWQTPDGTWETIITPEELKKQREEKK